LTENGELRGVKTKDGSASTPTIVSNARTAFLDLLNAGGLNERFVKHIKEDVLLELYGVPRC
jgi:hypothetical protein